VTFSKTRQPLSSHSTRHCRSASGFSRENLPLSRFLALDIASSCPHSTLTDNAETNVRALASSTPPCSSARFDGTPTQISPSSSITTAIGLRGQSLSATTTTATGRGRERKPSLRAIWKLHKRPNSATGFADWTECIQTRARILRKQCMHAHHSIQPQQV
jgi:hypothetical protein